MRPQTRAALAEFIAALEQAADANANVVSTLKRTAPAFAPYVPSTDALVASVSAVFSTAEQYARDFSNNLTGALAALSEQSKGEA